MAKEMLINVSEGEECRIALVEDGKLDELYMERQSATSHVNNIYKGRVTNVEASIQAAFVDFGLGRNGFLHISDLMPTYFGRKGENIEERVGQKMARRDRPPIQRCLRRGDELLVQVIKEGIGTKGPTLSTYLSVPGKILVMMPGMASKGVSRKIEDEVERRRLRQILDQLDPPDDCGFIIRTAGVGKSKLEIERDLKYLARLWETFKKKRDGAPAPVELYTEGDLVTRTVRDLFSADVDTIICDNVEVTERIREVIRLSSPRAKDRVVLHDETVPLLHKYGIEREIEQMYSRHVPLPSGGSLVIDSTEAIVAIDVNSGKNRASADAETTAFRVDMEAADEICRQLKLRDLGGVIICDFIDLRYERHRRELEHRLHELLKKDRAKTKVLRMSQFGIIEMTRQRMRPSLKRSVYFDCPHCKGAGLVKTPESMSLDVTRRIAIAVSDLKVARVELTINPEVAFSLLNKKRRYLADLEDKSKKRIVVRADPKLGLDEMKLELFDLREGLVFLPELEAVLAAPPHTTQLGTRHPGHTHQQRPAGRPIGGGRDGRGRGGSPVLGRGQEQRQLPPPERDERDEEASELEDRFDIDGDEEGQDERMDAPREADSDEGADQRVGGDDRDRGRGRGRQGQGQPQGRRDERGGGGGRGGDRGGRPPIQQDRQPANRGGGDNGRGQQGGGRPDNRQQQDNRQDPRQGGRPDNRQDPRPLDRQGPVRQGPPRQDAPRPDERDRQGVAAERVEGEAPRDGGAGTGQQGDDQQQGEGGRRRRRRRGRRGRGRNRNDQPGEPQFADGQAPPEGYEGEGPADSEDRSEAGEGELDEDRVNAVPMDERSHVGDNELGEAPQAIEDGDEAFAEAGAAGGDAPDRERDADSQGLFPVGGDRGGFDASHDRPSEEERDEDEDEATARADEREDAEVSERDDSEAGESVVEEPVTEATDVAEAAETGASKSKPRRGRAKPPAVAEEAPAARTPAKRGRGGKKPATAAKPIAKAPAPEPEDDAEASPKSHRRGGRGGRGRGRGKAAAGEGAASNEAAAAPARQPAAEAPAAKPRTRIADAPPPAVARGAARAADRHLVAGDDEPLLPEPPRRPRSYRDLDSIPDDLD